jgi:hypothetical protein
VAVGNGNNGATSQPIFADVPTGQILEEKVFSALLRRRKVLDSGWWDTEKMVSTAAEPLKKN